MRDPIAVAFGRVLREQRDLRGFTQEAMAERSHVDRTFISQIERGVRRATVTTLCKLSRGLDVSPSSLVLRMERELDGG